MNRTRLSSKGQVFLPKSIRDELLLEEGAEFVVATTADTIVLRRVTPFPATTLRQVHGCLPYSGRPKTLEQILALTRRPKLIS